MIPCPRHRALPAPARRVRVRPVHVLRVRVLQVRALRVPVLRPTGLPPRAHPLIRADLPGAHPPAGAAARLSGAAVRPRPLLRP